MTELSIYNTLTRQKEAFIPLADGFVKMFVCGPTVYDFCHLGHAKTFVQFDLVARYLRFCGYQLEYVQNITDIDDKIIARAREAGEEPKDLARRFEEAFIADMKALHVTSVDNYARAHDFIPQIVDQVQRLIDRGSAYELDDGWYFDLSTFPDYGKLSGRTMLMADDAVSRIDDHSGKRHPGDFALWKRSKPEEPAWETALGEGRPGWHIEDTAITETLFGPQYDLHGGAVDLVFPHHEAEIAQMESASGLAPLAKYWMHAGFLTVDSAKMSKSVGNFQTIREALNEIDWRTLRYACLSNHYRSAMELSAEVFQAAEASRHRIEAFGRSVDWSNTAADPKVQAVREQVHASLRDDFDTPAALAHLFSYIRDVNRSGDAPGAAAGELLAEFNSLFDVLADAESEESAGSAAIEERVRERDAHRQAGSWDAADRIRDELEAEGIVIEDANGGARWWRKS